MVCWRSVPELCAGRSCRDVNSYASGRGNQVMALTNIKRDQVGLIHAKETVACEHLK